MNFIYKDSSMTLHNQQYGNLLQASRYNFDSEQKFEEEDSEVENLRTEITNKVDKEIILDSPVNEMYQAVNVNQDNVKIEVKKRPELHIETTDDPPSCSDISSEEMHDKIISSPSYIQKKADLKVNNGNDFQISGSTIKRGHRRPRNI